MRATPNEREAAVELAVEIGAAEAARQLDMNVNTLRSWVSRAGRSTDPGSMAPATEARLATVADRKARLADDLLADAQRLRGQLFSPCTERKAMTVSDGKDMGSHVEIADIDLDQPTFADQRQIMTSIAIAVDKVQILTGEATERIEQIGGGEGSAAGERRQRATGVVDELAARRAS